jgi:dTDP-4-amino-4,6-dideoxygalactose transaminase
MDALAALCAGANLTLVEDAAQGSGARWRDRALGGIGDIGTYSFHGTKTVGCGEEGARIVNRPELVARAEMIWEKGTDRLRHRRGEIPHHDWCELGSSFVPSELTAAMLAEPLAAEKMFVTIDTRKQRLFNWCPRLLLLRRLRPDL